MADNFVSSLQTFSLIYARELDLITGPSLFRFDILVRVKYRLFYEEIRYFGGIYYESSYYDRKNQIEVPS